MIGILITIIAFSISIGLYIRQASTDSRDAALSGINVTAQITQNRSKAMKQASGSGGVNRSEMKKAMGADLTLTQLKKYAKASMDIFRRMADAGKCVIIVTHSSYAAGCADRCIKLRQMNHLQ